MLSSSLRIYNIYIYISIYYQQTSSSSSYSYLVLWNRYYPPEIVLKKVDIMYIGDDWDG